ncbi:MAG TPA: hypothetical protein VGM37_19540 [Armatimonadota bacterium]
MKLAVQPTRIRETRRHEFAVRFAFGGLVSALTGYIAIQYGPAVGGLFLAFPAILPASVTLVQKRHGNRAAGLDSIGAAMGAVGLSAFGGVAWDAGAAWPAWAVLAAAAVVWLAVGMSVWWVIRGRRKRRPSTAGAAAVKSG